MAEFPTRKRVREIQEEEYRSGCDGVARIYIPPSACRGRVHPMGKRFAGVLDTEAGTLRLDCFFWLEIDFDQLGLQVVRNAKDP